MIAPCPLIIHPRDCYHESGELMMTIRQGAAHMHDRDGLLAVAYEGVGSLSMAAIERYRHEQQKEVRAGIKVCWSV